MAESRHGEQAQRSVRSGCFRLPREVLLYRGVWRVYVWEQPRLLWIQGCFCHVIMSFWRSETRAKRLNHFARVFGCPEYAFCFVTTPSWVYILRLELVPGKHLEI